MRGMSVCCPVAPRAFEAAHPLPRQTGAVCARLPGCSQSLARVTLQPDVVKTAKATLRREAAEVGMRRLGVHNRSG